MISSIEFRVNYSETDQMGVVYHARYLVWMDMARTEYLRDTGLTYRELEECGTRLAVTEARVRYYQPARYDDRVRVRSWVRDVGSRRVTFGYAIERQETDDLLATGLTSLVSLNSAHRIRRLPEDVVTRLKPISDPVRL